MTDLSIVILTLDESVHITRAIEGARRIPLDLELFVIDSGSTDGTQELAEAAGATVRFHRFENQGRQFQWALDTLPFSSDWVMRLDADEVIHPELAAEIAETLRAAPDTLTGLVLKRRHIFWERWIAHGGRYPVSLLRIWRIGAAHVEQRWMDEHVVLERGSTRAMVNFFDDHSLTDLTFFTAKHNGYATREALDMVLSAHGLTAAGAPGRLPARARLIRFMKVNVYYRIPYTVSSALYFLYRYVVQLGFLDGRPGFVYHFLQGWWYNLLVGAKADEMRRLTADAPDADEIRRRLSAYSGIEV